ncbi:hypothetical protein B0H67DRAFT_567570 [Lasiosphaeris hirsuta]|uniref:Transmembrane protein n=1 Tax=Lasiosphaeris hirsuta TaxID=260670 RepID=A0AA40E6I0_9PEZI|nr:hypothetical protein B0H67DRAFT_567570 [Lasiosphaeris hirsuta]
MSNSSSNSPEAAPQASGEGFNCSERLENIQPDPDIAGVGIISSFLGTAWLVVFILVVYFVIFYDPTLDPFSVDPNKKLPRPNPVDMVFYKAKLWLLQPLDFLEPKYKWLASLRRKLRSDAGRAIFIQVIMALSDVQIVTGIAILVSGYYSATRGMSGYHWRMMVRVAWFSTITHLAALSCLRTYLHENKFTREIRLLLMGCLAVMLIVATLVTADGGFSDELPVICFLNISKSPTALQNSDVLAAVFLLIYNIILRGLKLHQAVAEGRSLKIRQWFVRRLARPVAMVVLEYVASTDEHRMRKRAIYIFLVQPMLASLVLAKTYYLTYTSTIGEIYWLLVSAFWGTLRLFELRRLRSQGEDNWTFGQIVPCALFLAPVLALLDAVAKTLKGDDNLPRSRRSEARTTPSNRYQRWFERPTVSPRWFGDDAIRSTNPPVEPTLLRLQTLESSITALNLSTLPLFAYSEESQDPFLGFFEDSTSFPYLTMQLCAWFMFMTFWVFFSDFGLFERVVNTIYANVVMVWGAALWSYETTLDGALPFGRFEDHSPAFTIFYLLPWIFLLGPTYSVFWLLSCPRSTTPKWEYKSAWGVLFRLFLCAVYVLCPMLTYLYCSFLLALIIWACCIGIYLLLSVIARVYY